MTLAETLVNAGVNFSFGFSLGYSDFKINKNSFSERDIDIIQAAIPNNNPVYEKLTEPLNKMTGHYTRLRWLFPYITSFAFSRVSSLVSDQTLMGNMAVALPAAYLGTFAGRLARKYKNRGLKQDIEILRKITNDPENAIKYIPKEQREQIESGFNELERLISEKQDIEELLHDENGPSGKIFHAIIEPKKVYTSILLDWSTEEHKRTYQRSKMQEMITGFFDKCPVPISGMCYGDMKKTKFRMYEIDGERLFVHLINMDGITTITRDEERTKEVRNIASIETEEQIPWNRDYRSLARRIIAENNHEAFMLLKSIPGTPDIFKRLAATDLYLSSAIKQEEN